MNLLEAYVQPLREELEEKDKKIDLISRENIQLKEESKALQRKYEEIIKELKEKLSKR